MKKKEKEKEEEGRTLNTQDWTQEKKGNKKKKKKVDWSKGAAKLLLVGPLCMFNYKNVIEL